MRSMSKAVVATIESIRLENARRLLVDECGDVQAQFARRVDYSRQLVNNYIGKTPTKTIGSNVARKIEAAFGRHIGWLDERHEMAADSLSSDAVISGLSGRGDISSAVPVLLQSMVNQLNTSREWLRRNVGARPPESIVMETVPGDEMSPTLPEGTVVLVDKNATSLEGGGVYMMTAADPTRRGEVFFRRVSRTLDGRYRIMGDNPKTAAETHDSMKSAKVLVIGRVLATLEVKRL